MATHAALLPLLAPAALLAAALIARTEPGLRPLRTLLACQAAAGLALAAAIASAGALALLGPASSPLLGAAGVGLSVRIDALSVTMLLLVSFVGLVVVRFSRNYLDGDARQGEFLGGLCATLAAVSLLVIAGNLLLLVAAWVATSLALHRLLVFYPERSGASVAARKKFVVARIGDACLIGAAALLLHAFGSADVATILAAARAGEDAAPWAAALIALAALLKSAQFPTHGWLTEVMETPTPVSALLHAGIVNAGGFLVVRFADVMLGAPQVLALLAVIGGFTALFGCVAMLAQTRVKTSLAYSTVAQMGFMMLQCGLGAFSSAVLHLVAHSLYKAHAFLSSGSAVEAVRAARGPADARAPGVRAVLGSLVAAIAVVVAAGALTGFHVDDKPAIVALGAILAMGLSQLVARPLADTPSVELLARTCLAASLVALAWFALQGAAAALLASTLPPSPAPGAATLVLMALLVAAFAAVTLAQTLAPRLVSDRRARAAYVLVANGLYASALFDRLTGALRKRPAQTSTVTP